MQKVDLSNVRETIKINKDELMGNKELTNELLVDDIMLALGYNKKRNTGVQRLYGTNIDWIVNIDDIKRFAVITVGYGQQTHDLNLKDNVELKNYKLVLVTDGESMTVYETARSLQDSIFCFNIFDDIEEIKNVLFNLTLNNYSYENIIGYYNDVQSKINKIQKEIENLITLGKYRLSNKCYEVFKTFILVNRESDDNDESRNSAMLSKKIESLNKQLEAANKISEKAQQEVNSLNVKILELSKNSGDGQKEEIRRLNNVIKDLKKRSEEDKEKAIKDKQEELDNLKNVYESKIKDYDSQKANFEKELETVKKELKDKEEELSKVNREKAVLNDEITKVSSSESALSNTINEEDFNEFENTDLSEDSLFEEVAEEDSLFDSNVAEDTSDSLFDTKDVAEDTSDSLFDTSDNDYDGKQVTYDEEEEYVDRGSAPISIEEEPVNTAVFSRNKDSRIIKVPMADISDIAWSQGVVLDRIEYIEIDKGNIYKTAVGSKIDTTNMTVMTCKIIDALVLGGKNVKENIEKMKNINLDGVSKYVEKLNASNVNKFKISFAPYVISDIDSVNKSISIIQAVAENLQLNANNIKLYISGTFNGTEAERYIIPDNEVRMKSNKSYGENNREVIKETVLEGDIADKIIITKKGLKMQSQLFKKCEMVKSGAERYLIDTEEGIGNLFKILIEQCENEGRKFNPNSVGRVINTKEKVISTNPSEVAGKYIEIEANGNTYYISEMEASQLIYAVVRMHVVALHSNNVFIKVKVDEEAYNFYKEEFRNSDPSLSLSVKSLVEYLKGRI